MTDQPDSCPIYHRSDPNCGKVAMFLLEHPARYSAIRAAQFRMPDGSTPAVGSVRRCGACGAELGEYDIKRSMSEADWGFAGE